MNKVLIAMSGGVDSSVTACLMKEQGYYDYTDDKSVLERAYPMSKSYVLGYSVNSDSLVEHKKGS